MRRILISIFGVFMIFSAFGEGENIPTSKSYVDAEIATKQDKISANNGAAQVLTNTGTAGEYGTKGIYDSTGTYSTQSDGLIDAVTMNTAVQNAIDSEFQCVEYNPNDPTDCWLMDVRGETGKSILPSGYTALEYIESTGTQYIKTNIWINKIDKAEAKFNAQFNGSGWFGANAFMQLSTDGSYSVSGRSTAFPVGNKDNIIMKYENYKLSLYVNEQTVQSTTWQNYSNTRTMYYIFTLGNQDGVAITSVRSSGKIYDLKLTVNDTIVRNYIPAQRDSDGEIGMYDMVSGTFFTNAGSGDFIAGPVVNLYLPVGQ